MYAQSQCEIKAPASSRLPADSWLRMEMLYGGVKPHTMLAMLCGYYDESGGVDHGVTVVCGYVATAERWACFELEWREMLSHHGVPHLHMKEYVHSKGPYEKWADNSDGRAAFLADASAIIRRNVQLGLMAAVRHDAFESVNRRYYLRENVHSPYALAGRWAVAKSNAFANRQGLSPKDSKHYFDRGGPDIGGLLDLANRSEFFWLPMFHHSRGEMCAMPLQAADYFAYEVRKAVATKAPDAPPKDFRLSFQALFDVEIEQGNYGEQELTELCESLRLRR